MSDACSSNEDEQEDPDDYRKGNGYFFMLL